MRCHAPVETVENYLKTIYLAQAALARAGDLVPMGQVAAALGVMPGTATTMVKALAESGLVRLRAVHRRAADAGRRKARRASCCGGIGSSSSFSCRCWA